MSLHICLVTNDLKEDHPTWNWDKFVGDRNIAHLLKLPCESVQVDDVTEIYRPKDFDQWRDTLASWPQDRENSERFPKMLELLEANTDYWIYLSI